MSTLQNLMNNRAMLAALVVGSTLAAPQALAQFRVEYDRQDRPRQEARQERSETHTIMITSSDDEHSYELKIVNGHIEVAKLDGEELDRDRVEQRDGVVAFLDEDGKTLREFVVRPEPELERARKGARALTWITREEQQRADAPKPRVMLGINLTEPSEAVRKQLNLKPDQKAIFVERVIEGLPADKAGLEDYDVIISLDGSNEASSEMLTKILQEKKPGDTLNMTVLRAGEKIKLQVRLQEYDPQKLGIPELEININPPSGRDFLAPLGDLRRLESDFSIMPDLREQILEALNASGLDEEQIRRVQEELQKQLGNMDHMFRWRGFFDAPRFPDADAEAPEDLDLPEARRRFAEEQERFARQMDELSAQEKARAAMRDIQRQVLELRDGQLFIRQSDQTKSQLKDVEDHLDRLEEQLESFENRMERMADMLERLLERLEDDED